MRTLLLLLSLVLSASLGCTPCASCYQESPCFTCVASSCADSIEQCRREDTCAAALACIGRCPLNPAGDSLESCEQACPLPATKAGQDALSAMQRCRSAGAGAACTACGRPMATEVPALLQQVCPSGPMASCSECLNTRCCNSQSELRNAKNLNDYLDCVLKKCPQGDKSCKIDCDVAWSDVYAATYKNSACLELQCATECKLQRDACTTCTNTNCRNQRGAAEERKDVALYRLCVADLRRAGCGAADPNCENKCAAMYKEAAAIFTRLTTCNYDNCSALCVP